MEQARQREQAHIFIDGLPEEKLFAIYGLLEVLVDPVSRALANAPYDDEPVSEEEARDLAEAHAAYVRGEFVSHEEVLAEFGLTAADFERGRLTTGAVGLEPELRHP